MAVKKNSLFKRPGFKLGLKIAAILAVCAALSAGVWLIFLALFQNNPNLTLDKVIVRSRGWWRGRSAEVAKIARLSPGSENIFAVDLAEVRRLVEAEPSVKSATVSRILPNILAVDIVERAPRAFIHFRGNAKVVDDDCIVMTTDSCIDVSPTLPVVTGFRAGKDDLLPGKAVLAVKPALTLLDKLRESVPDLDVRRVALSNPAYFYLRARYPGIRDEFDLYLDRAKPAGKIAKLEKILKNVAKLRPNAKVVDVRYDGQAVVK